MRIKQHTGAAFALLLATLAGQVPSLAAQEPEKRVIKGTENCDAAVRVETLNLRRRDGGMMTLRVAYGDASTGEVQRGDKSSRE